MKRYETHQMAQDVTLTGGFEIEPLPQFFETEAARTCYELHSHTYYEIIWFQDGGGIHTIDFVDYTVEPNTFFFISPGQLHKFDKTKQTGIIIKFLSEFLNNEDTTEDIFLKYSIFNAYDSISKIVVNDEAFLKTIQNILRAVEFEMPQRELFGHLSFMQSLVRILLIMFERHDGSGSPARLSSTNSVHQYFIRFRQALEQDYKRIHNVQEYASQLGISTKYLSQIVRTCANRTPLQLINERILLEAKRQLRYSNMMIKEIAFDLGYDDPSYFVKQFKRLTGMLPSDFREA